MLGLATETRIPGEKDDFAARPANLGTLTAVDGESDDDDLQARVSGVGSDALYAGTKTGARGEADDFWSDEDVARPNGPALVRP